MTLKSILNKIPSYAKEIKANLEKLYLSESTGLSDHQLYSVSLAICYAIKHEQLINTFRNEAKFYADEGYLEAAKAAAVIVAQNNTFYNFTTQCKIPDLQSAKLLLGDSALYNHGIDTTDFSMCLLGISIIHKCTYCCNFYVDILLKKNIPVELIASIARVASVLQATAEVLEIETIRNYEFTPRGENI